MSGPDAVVNVFNNEPADAFVRLDKSTWIRRSAVAEVRMGPKNQTHVYLLGVAHPFEVDSPISEVLKALGSVEES